MRRATNHSDNTWGLKGTIVSAESPLLTCCSSLPLLVAVTGVAAVAGTSKAPCNNEKRTSMLIQAGSAMLQATPAIFVASAAAAVVVVVPAAIVVVVVVAALGAAILSLVNENSFSKELLSNDMSPTLGKMELPNSALTVSNSISKSIRRKHHRDWWPGRSRISASQSLSRWSRTRNFFRIPVITVHTCSPCFLFSLFSPFKLWLQRSLSSSSQFSNTHLQNFTSAVTVLLHSRSNMFWASSQSMILRMT
mmetsp:Transcript_5991/g.9886  ORF Transcript_5991/g.9886 Transcript_5991/m.9886 type:complete len:250 (-) Transcript_5991:1633-2382(-)